MADWVEAASVEECVPEPEPAVVPEVQAEEEKSVEEVVPTEEVVTTEGCNGTQSAAEVSAVDLSEFEQTPVIDETVAQLCPKTLAMEISPLEGLVSAEPPESLH
ncbi:hypothetical protein CRUP_029741 [Coryphaenoides rupestris]|nr:hypothetical protein CRUP_029741 [Coryphaenoides rupestris]